MRVLLLGAGGFLGRAIVAELLAHGHTVTAVVRPHSSGGSLPSEVQRIELDLAQATSPADWESLLSGVDLVVNAAGLLRGRSMEAVHVAMPRALHAAALAADVRRIVLISAISARPEVPTDYAQTKLAGEDALRSSGLAWTILRPSLVYGDGSYGGSSLLRALAALPWFVPVPGDGHFAFAPIHARDLARAVHLVCDDERFAGQTLEPMGPDVVSLSDLLGRYRRWLGFGKPRLVSFPMPFMNGFAKVGDFFGRGPISSNSLKQLIAGNAGEPDIFARAIGFKPSSLDENLRGHPAQVQDRWHARLFFLAPALRAILIVMWLASGLLGLLNGKVQTAAFVAALGMPDRLADPLRIGSSLCDLAVAILVMADRRATIATPVQVFLVASYTLMIGWAMPGLWFDPLGPLLKNLPVLAAILAYGAIADQR